MAIAKSSGQKVVSMPSLTAQLAKIEREQGRLAEVQIRHDEKDDTRFEKARTDREEGDRRLYDRLEEMFKSFKADIKHELGEWDTKANTLLTTYTQKVNALEVERADALLQREKALSYQAGIAAAKTPTPTQLAWTQGIAGAAATAGVGAFIAVLVMAATLFVMDVGPGRVVLSGAPAHEGTKH